MLTWNDNMEWNKGPNWGSASKNWSYYFLSQVDKGPQLHDFTLRAALKYCLPKVNVIFPDYSMPITQDGFCELISEQKT